jgi:hypothetical protein
MLVSSTNITTSEILFINIGKSLMYRPKSRGPETDPWGNTKPYIKLIWDFITF